MASADPREELSCSICLEIYTNPVNLSCGHNYCRDCIDRVLDTQEERGVYSCPECRVTFFERPALQRNIALCNIAEHFRPAQPEKPCPGICCTYCIDTPQPAVKSCLMCEASLCDGHLRVHSKSAEHVFSEPTTALGNRKCLVHKKILEYYCTEDNALICVSCRLDGKHKGHQVESLDEASDKKKKKLRNLLDKLIAKREENDHRMQRLQDRRRDVQENALIPNSYLEIKRAELFKKIQHIKEMCIMSDPLTLLLDQESEREDYYHTEKEGNVDRGRYGKEVHNVGDLVEGLILKPLHSTYDQIQDSGIVLDVNTAAKNILVSSDLKTVSWSAVYQNCPDNHKRFQYNQVFSTRSFSSGQYSWDVETNASADWRLGVAYSSVDRRGYESYIGENKASWCLRKLYNNQYSAMHDSDVVAKLHRFSCYKFRIYLDYEAGQLSFYELCDPVRHLHTFTATFTEPLHAAFGVGYWLSSEHCWLRIIDRETIQ